MYKKKCFILLCVCCYEFVKPGLFFVAGQPATTPTRSPSITSGKPSTASTPTTGTEAGGPGTSPSLIPTTTGPASTTTGILIVRISANYSRYKYSFELANSL